MPTWDAQLTSKADPVEEDEIPIIDSSVAVGVNGREKLSTISDIRKIPKAFGETYMLTETQVAISAQNTVTLIGGANWTDGNLNNFTATIGGRLTYTGTPDIDVIVFFGASLEVQGALAAEQVMNHAIANGDTAGANQGLISETIVPSENTGFEIFRGVKTNDFFEMGVSNRDSTRNIPVIKGKLVVMQI